MIYINGKFYVQPITGVQRFAREIVSNLMNIRNDVCILIPKGTASSIPMGLKFKEVGNFKGILWEQIDLPIYLKGENDILLNLTNSAPIIYNKNIFTLHDIIFNYYPKSYPFLQFLYYKISSRLNLNRSILNLTVSEYSKEIIINYYKNLNLNGKIEVIYNSVIENQELEVECLNINKEHFELKSLDDYIVFTTLSSFDDNKNLAFVVDVFNELDIENSLLILAGGHVMSYQGIKDVLRNNKINITGRLSDSDLFYLYQKSFAFIIPSKMEGFGIPPLEAQSRGCPVISSSRSSLPEVLGESALYFDPDNKEELINAIKNLVNNTHLREWYRIKGFENLKKFSFQESAMKLSNIIDGIFNEKK